MSITISGTGTSGGTVAAGAFNTTPAFSGSFIPQIWSGKLNVKFYATTVFGEIANTDYEGDIKNLGDTVIINNIPDISISDYQVGQTLNYQVPAPNKIQLNINKAKYFGVNVSDVIAYQSQPKLMDMFTGDAGKQMAIAIDSDILKNSVGTADATNQGITAGAKSGAFNLGSAAVPVVMTTTSIVQMITQMASSLDENNVPDTDRYLIISPYIRNLLMNSQLQQAYITGDPESTLRNGKIGRIDRFTIYVSNLLPVGPAGFGYDGVTVAAGAVARKCMIAGHKTAITFASQITKVESMPNPQDFGQLVRGLNVFGYGTIKPTSLVLAQVN
jgi:hypothetical protein